MQITIRLPEKVVRAAEARQVPLIEFVEDLVARGLESIQPRPALSSAMERIRALASKDRGSAP
jgi:hypothetical protein